MLSVILAHNLNRELQMRTSNEQSSPLWVFEKIQALRNAFISRKTGRFARPAGKPIFTLNANPSVLLYMRIYLAAKGNFWKVWIWATNSGLSQHKERSVSYW